MVGSQGGEYQGLAKGREPLGQLVVRDVPITKDGVSQLPQGKRRTGREAGPEQDGSGWLVGQLGHCPADVGLAAAAHRELDCDDANEDVQQAAHGVSRAGNGCESLRISGFLGHVGGLSHLILDDKPPC